MVNFARLPNLAPKVEVPKGKRFCPNFLTDRRYGNRAILNRNPRAESLVFNPEPFPTTRPLLRKQYLHLSVFLCETCSGPVVAGSTAVRENEISKETDIQSVGAPTCLSCGRRQETPTEPARARHVPPIPWDLSHLINPRLPTAALVEKLNHTDLH